LNGIVASTVANAFAGSEKKSWSPTDFMPSRWREKAKKPRRKRLTKTEAQRQNDNFRAFFLAQANAQRIANNEPLIPFEK
jgi:hypothetical protein